MINLILKHKIDDFKKLTLSQKEVREAFLFSISDDKFIQYTEYLFDLIVEEDFLDTFMVSIQNKVFNENVFQYKTASFFFDKKLKENVRISVHTSEKGTFKEFLSNMPNGFEAFIKQVVSKGSLESVQFVFKKTNLNYKDYLSVAYHNTVEVFFYVLNSSHISNEDLNNLIKNKLKKDSFNFELVKELVIKDKLIVDEELANFVIMDKIRIFKNFNSKPLSLNKKELVKI